MRNKHSLARWSAVFLLGLAVAGTPPPVWAHTGQWGVCCRAKAAIQVDGDWGEWPAPAVMVGSERRTFGTARGPEDISLAWRAAWDEQFLYVAAEVTDDHLQFEKTRDKIFENDCVEVCVDARNDSVNTYGPDDFQFVFSPSGPDGKPQKWLFRNPVRANLDPPEVKFAARLQKKGYTIETAIPWKMLGIEPRAGMAIGFNIDVRDYDPKQEVKGLPWSGTGDVCGDPMLWGDVILVGDAGEDVQVIVQQLKKTGEARTAKLARMEKPEETENAVTLTVLPEPVGTLTLGLGWNWVYRGDDTWDWDDQTWNSFFEMMKWTGCAWVRYGVFGDQWEPANDDADPNHFNWAAFTFDSPMMQQHYRSLDFCEKAGIKVLLCNWRPPKWLREGTREAPPKPGQPSHDAPYDTDEFIESIAAIIHQLKVVKKYDCVKYISLWNEPNFSYRSATKTYPETFWTYYAPLDKKLREMGLRDKIGILGPDTSTGGKSLGHIVDMLKLHGPLLDVIADHDYDDYIEYKPHKRGTPMSQGIAAYVQLAKAARALYGRHVPVTITEFGNYGNGARDVNDDNAVFEGSLSTAELVLRLANAGLDGFLRWEFRVYSRGWRNFGSLTDSDPVCLFKPYGPVYYPASLLGRYVTPGSTVLGIRFEGGRDENGTPRVVSSAFRLPDGNLTVILVNDGFLPKQVKLILPDKKVERLRCLFCAADSIHEIQKAKDCAVTNEECAIELKPRSITALTTIEKGTSAEDLAIPAKFAVPRREPGYVTDEKTGERRLEFSFEQGGAWSFWTNSEGKSGFTRSTEEAHAGRYSGKYTYDLVSPKREQIIPWISARLEKKPVFISMWVYGDGSGHELALNLIDSKGETFGHFLAPVTWTGWRRVDRKLDDMPKGWNHWGKNADGIVDLPIVTVQFPLTKSDKSAKKTGAIYMDEVMIQ